MSTKQPSADQQEDEEYDPPSYELSTWEYFRLNPTPEQLACLEPIVKAGFKKKKLERLVAAALFEQQVFLNPRTPPLEREPTESRSRGLIALMAAEPDLLAEYVRWLLDRASDLDFLDRAEVLELDHDAFNAHVLDVQRRLLQTEALSREARKLRKQIARSDKPNRRHLEQLVVALVKYILTTDPARLENLLRGSSKQVGWSRVPMELLNGFAIFRLSRDQQGTGRTYKLKSNPAYDRDDVRSVWKNWCKRTGYNLPTRNS